jgi:hypothetical protein
MGRYDCGIRMVTGPPLPGKPTRRTSGSAESAAPGGLLTKMIAEKRQELHLPSGWSEESGPRMGRFTCHDGSSRLWP